MSDASKITLAHAEQLLEEHSWESQGTITIDGEDFDWWTDAKSRVWFYDPRADGENTIKRFESNGLYEV